MKTMRYVAMAGLVLFCLECRAAYAQENSDLDSILGASAAAQNPSTAPSQSSPTAATPATPDASAGKDAATAQGTPPSGATPPVQPDQAATPAEDAGGTVAIAHPASKNRMVEEIVVTAQKREENIQKVPISIQAFSGAQLDAKGIEEPSKLALVTPGLQYNTLVGYTFIYIRGVGSDTFIPSADASVATYIDGIYYPFGFGLASALGSVQRVEVLKGPQGTLFGRNSSGGALSIITKQPDPGSDFTASLLGSRESFDTYRVRAFTNIPLNDSLAVSLSGLRYQGDSFYKESSNSNHPGPQASEISQGFSSKLGWKPFEDLKAVFGYTFLNTRGSYGALLPAGNGPGDITPLGKLLGVTASPDYINGDNAPEFINIYSRVANADIKFHTPWFDTRFLGAVEHISPADVAVDYDGSSAPLVSFETTGQFAHVRTGELQFISNDSAPDWLKVVGGFYYINSLAGYHSIEFNVAQGALGFLQNPTGPLTGLTSPLISLLENVPVLGNVLNDFNGGLNTNGLATLVLNGELATVSEAAYLQGTVDLTNRLSLTLGGRFQEEHRTLVVSKLLLRNPLNRSDLVTLLSFPSRDANTTNFSPKGVVDFKLNEDQHVYASYTQGFKSGTFNIIAIDTPPSYVPPEKVTAYEIGYKATLLDGAMKFNAAVFQNQIKDLQVGIVSLTSGGVTNFETAGSAKVRGADFDVTWQVLPETLPGLVLAGGGAFLHGRYTHYPNGSGFDDTTGLFYGGTGLLIGGGVTPGRDFTGHKMVRTPTISGNISPSYAFDLGPGQVEVSADFYYNSGFFFSASNSELTHQSPYRIVGARASYYYETWKTRLTAFGENLTNQRYYQTIQQFDFDTSKKLSSPITFGVKLQWDY